MKRSSILLATVLLLAIAVPTFADIARPKQTPSPSEPKVVLHTRLAIVPDNKAWEARLQIPQSDLQELRAALGDVPADGTMAQRLTHSSTRTMIAGVFMFLSLSFAGVWLARSMQTRSQKLVAALLVGTALFSAAALITNANAGPPGSYYWKNLPKNISKGQTTSGGIDIEIVPDSSDGSGMKLIIPVKPD
jgi:hypothetical protein